MHPELTVAQILELFSAADGRRVTRLLREHGDDTRAGVQAACTSARARVAADRAETRRTQKLYEIECSLRGQGHAIVAGVDEVGRGALAGPLTVAAVVLPAEPMIEGLDDSKRLTPNRREELAATIHEVAVAVCIRHIAADDIDSLGLTAALKLGVRGSLDGLGVSVDHVLIDGLPLRACDNETAIVKGDSKVASIAAASIVAKVARDALMREFGRTIPGYGFEINKGYGTAEHLDALLTCGPCHIHRRSFSPGGGTIPLF